MKVSNAWDDASPDTLAHASMIGPNMGIISRITAYSSFSRLVYPLKQFDLRVRDYEWVDNQINRSSSSSAFAIPA